MPSESFGGITFILSFTVLTSKLVISRPVFKYLCYICETFLQILSMIEEAAGTRLYESKKEAAQRTIGKKDAKLKEIDTVSLALISLKN